MTRPSRSGGQGGVQPESELPSLTLDPLFDQVRAFRPWELGPTIRLRVRLNRTVILSAMRATRAESPHARTAFWLANEIATQWLWATASDDELGDMLAAALRLVTCGEACERNGSGS